MAIHLDVYADLNDRSVRSASDRLHDDLERAGQRSGRAFGEQFGRGLESGVPSSVKLEKATDRVADALGRVNVEQSRHNKLVSDGVNDESRLIVQSERLASAQRKHAAAVREAVRAQLDMRESSRGLNADAVTLNQTLSLLGKSGMAFGWAAAVPTLTVAAGAAVSAAGALALLPAAAGAAGAAFGTLKIATLGFGDAMSSVRDPEKFAEALQSLSPNAQQAALSIRQLMPAFDGLKNATQDALFDGMAGQLQRLSGALLPTIESMTTGVAGAFNQMFTGVTDQLMTPETSAAITDITTNITTAFQNLAPAAAPFTKAITDIMSVGSDFLPQLATAASNAAQAFSTFIAQSRESGQLREWIADAGEILGQVAGIVWDVGRAFAALAPVAKDVLPYISGAVREIADILREHPGLIWGVVGAFSAWKTIEGVAALTTSLGTIANLLRVTLPAAAAAGATGITGALAAVSIPAWLATLTKWAGPLGVGLQSDQKNAADVGLPTVQFDGQGRPYLPGSPHDPGLKGAPSLSRGALDGIHGTGGTMPSSLAPWAPLPVPVPTGTGNGGGPKLPDAPVLPYDTSLPGGFGSLPQTSEIVGAENAWMDARHTLAEKQARVNQLENDNNASQDDIQKARNDVVNAQQQQQQAELRLYDARQSLFDKQNKQLRQQATDLGEIGASLDSDFGISKGLSGIAENITKFVANVAAAPLLGKLAAIRDANPSQGGYGAMGILGAQGAFGPRFTGVDNSQQQQGGQYVLAPTPLGGGLGTPLVGGGQPYGLPGGTNTGGYGSSGAVFPPWVHALEQAFGVKASTYAGHQEGDRHEAGYAPNPNHENRGIDWSGSVDAMQKFADYLKTIPGDLEQVIWQNPNTGQRTGIAGGQDVSGTGYYAGDYGGHQNHVHTRQSMSLPAPSNFAASYDAANTNPALSNPAPIGGTGSGAPFPGYGPPPLAGAPAFGVPQPAPAFADRQYGGVEPAAGTGPGGIGITPGGTLDTALGIGASLLPGGGQLAQTGIKLASRGIQFGGQAAGIAAQGALDTFLPTGGSELANNNWITRILGGVAGAAPALPNVAGKSSQPTPEDVANVDPNTTQHGTGGGQAPGPTTNITVNNQRATEDGTGRDIAWLQMQANTMPGH